MGEDNVFESNAAKLRELQAAIHKTVTHRGDGDSQRRAWQEACERFHSSYNALAFPGGLSTAFTRLDEQDPAAVEMAVRFLEANPWFFRSGYIKADLMKRLRKVTLTDEQRRRLQQVILARIQAHETPREFRWYGRLARAVNDTEFQEQISALTGFSSIRGLHARWVLEQMIGSQPKAKPHVIHHPRRGCEELNQLHAESIRLLAQYEAVCDDLKMTSKNDRSYAQKKNEVKAIQGQLREAEKRVQQHVTQHGCR